MQHPSMKQQILTYSFEAEIKSLQRLPISKDTYIKNGLQFNDDITTTNGKLKIDHSCETLANATKSGPIGGGSLIFHDKQFTDVNRLKSDKPSAATINGGSIVINNHHNKNNSNKFSNCSTSNSTSFPLLEVADSIESTKLIAEPSNLRNSPVTPSDINHSIFIKNNSERVFDYSLSPSIARIIKPELINRNKTKELATAMSGSFDRATKPNHTSTESSIVTSSNSTSNKHTKSNTTTMTTTFNTTTKSNSTHAKRSEVLIVKNSSSRKLGGFVDKIANLTKYDSMSHLGRHLIKHNYNTSTKPTATHINHSTDTTSSCCESSTTSKSCSSTPSSAAVSMNSSAKSSISNLSSTGGVSCINSVPYVDHHANQSVTPPHNNANTTAMNSNLHNHQSLFAHSTNNLCRPIINIIEQTAQLDSQSTLRQISKNEENFRDANSVAIFQKSSTYNNVMDHQTNYMKKIEGVSSDNMDQASLNINKFCHSASANNLYGSSIESSQNTIDLEQNTKKKNSITRSFLSVDPSNATRCFRRKAKKEAKKAKLKHQENVEQLRTLVDYLHHNSKPLSLSLEAEEIELARSFKLNYKLCDECLSASEYSIPHSPSVPTDIDIDGNEQQTPMLPASESQPNDIVRCHRCKKPIDRPESISHFSDSAITNSDQDSNDDNKTEERTVPLDTSKPHTSIWQNKVIKCCRPDDILDKFLAKQKGNIVARAAKRGSVFQPKILFVSFEKNNNLGDISRFARCLPMRSWTSELFLPSNESSELLDSAVKRELLSNYSYEDFRHVITPELSSFSKNVESMLAMSGKRRRSLTTGAKKQRIRFRKFSQVGSDKMWDVERLQQKNRKIYHERLQVIRSVPNRHSACSDSSGLNSEDKNLEGFDGVVDAAGTDSADYEGSDSQLNDDFEDGSAIIHHNLETIDARLLAEEMTLISRDLLLSVDHIELARILLEPHLVDTKNCPNIVILLDFDRRIYHLLITEIVSRSDVEDRVEIVAKLIDVSVILNELKNYFSLNSVLSALHSPPIARLNSTWISLKNRYIGKYDSLVKLSNQVMTTYDLTDLDESPNSDDKEKEMNLRQMIDSCSIPQFELIVNQMKKSILEFMRTKPASPFPVQSTPLSSHQTRPLSTNADDLSNNGRAHAGAWTNPQNLAVWIDHEINSLIQELETKSAQQKPKKRRSAKWLRGGRRNSSHSNDSSGKNNDSGISGITKSLSSASLAPPSSEFPNGGSLWSRLLSKKRKNKSNSIRGASPRESINPEESRKSSLSDKWPSNASSDLNLKGLASANDLTAPITSYQHPPQTSIASSNPEKTFDIQHQVSTKIQVTTPENQTNTQLEVLKHSKAISRSESYHYLLSDISTENKKFVMNLIQTWLIDLHNKMNTTLSKLQDSVLYKDKSSYDAREFLLMQAYKPLKKCLVLSLQCEPLTKDKCQAVVHQYPNNSHNKVIVMNDNVLESTRL